MLFAMSCVNINIYELAFVIAIAIYELYSKLLFTCMAG